jgi:hypothetical protein
MTDHGATKRYAVLVGIELYLNNGSRKLENGQPLSVSNLEGCVNDVKSFESFIQEKYQLDNTAILTSSAPDTIDKRPMIPREPLDLWPTFNARNLFFFHFSGHGARLKPVKSSPAGRPNDPSLLTVDFCCGQREVRGWQLNHWLKRLNEKEVQVVVVLDSCHAGAAIAFGHQIGPQFLILLLMNSLSRKKP